jgi:hypothetical protein
MASRKDLATASLLVLTVAWMNSPSRAENYPIVDTGQERCYNSTH